MFGARKLLARFSDAERREEVSELAGSLNGPVGATLAFLVGFAVSITWTTMSSAQSSVEKLGAQAQQTALLIGSTLDRPDDQRISDDLVAYLNTIAKRGQRRPLAGGGARDAVLRGTSRSCRATCTTSSRHAPAGTDAASLRTLQSQVLAARAVSRPSSTRWRVAACLRWCSSCSSSPDACPPPRVGMLAVKIRRPYLIVGWAVVIAMGLTVVMALYNPFDGSVAVTFDPLTDAAARIAMH